MKIAYLIVLHHKFEQFRWLFEAIQSEEDTFLIHIDKKSSQAFCNSVESYVGTRPNVSFLPRRSVNWGGWTQVSVELDAIKTLLRSPRNWDYLINISGQDYPIKSLADIKSKLRAEYPKNWIRVVPFDLIKQTEPSDPHLKRLLVLELFGRVWRTRVSLPFPSAINIKFKGSQWHMLTRDFCKWIDSNPMTEKIANLIKHTLIPDEIFFQALIMNSPFQTLRTPDFGRVVIWPGPKIIRTEDIGHLMSSNDLFARKFDESVDRKVMEHLAREHGFGHPGDA